MFRSYSYVNRAPYRSLSDARVTLGWEADTSQEPSRRERRQNWCRWMPSQPIATWIMPCNSRKVQASDTSTRRHTIGLIPSSHTLT